MNKIHPFLRWLAYLGVLLAGLTLAGIWTFSAVVLTMGSSVVPWLGVTIILVLLGMTVWKKWFGSWRNILVGAGALAVIYLWMGWDAPKFDRPLTLADLGPPPPDGAVESHALTLWFSEIDGKPSAHKFTEPKLTLKPFDHDPKKPEAWPKELRAHEAEVHAAWAALEQERGWFASLDRFATIGDLTEGRPDSPIIRFQPFRFTFRTACAQATLLAMDGKGDEAIDVLLPFIRVCRKLEPSSRTLVRAMIARVGLGMTIRSAQFVLQHSNVSPERKAQLAAAVAGGEPAALVHRMIELEYAHAYEGVFRTRELRLGDLLGSDMGNQTFLRWLLNGLDRLLFLRRTTANLYAQRSEKLADLAARRELKAFDSEGMESFKQMNSGPLKNVGGVTALSMMLPSLQKVTERFWEIEDARNKLLAELKQ